MDDSLLVLPMQLVYRLVDPVELSQFRGPMFRGALGQGLKDLNSPLFDEWFQTTRDDLPKPYRIRCPLAKREVLPPGTLLSFGLDLFGPAALRSKEVLAGCRKAGQCGFGESRGRAELILASPYSPLGMASPRPGRPAAIKVWRQRPPTDEWHLRCLAPLSLAGQAELPDLPHLFTALRRRWSNLSGRRLPPLPPEAMEWTIDWRQQKEVHLERRSRRSGELGLVGWTGSGRAAGPCFPELGLLMKGLSLIGAGKWTVFGFGHLEAIPIPAPDQQ